MVLALNCIFIRDQTDQVIHRHYLPKGEYLTIKAPELSQKKIINKTFRNNNGVAMKLQNFRSLDDQFKGKGLRRGGGLEHEIWDKFNSLNKITKEADNVRKNIEN